MKGTISMEKERTIPRKRIKTVPINPKPKPKKKRKPPKRRPDPDYGQKYGRLTVLHKSDRITKQPYTLKSGEKRYSERKLHYVCQCECGRTKEIRKQHLVSGHTKSCGCLAKQIYAQRKQQERNRKRSHSFWNHENIDEYMGDIDEINSYW